MSSEFQFLRRDTPNQKAQHNTEVEEQKAKIRASDPRLFQLIERYYAIGRQFKLLSGKLQERYSGTEEDWFNITDYVKRNGEDSYQQFITEAEECLTLREREVAVLKDKLEEVGADNLSVYQKMRGEMRQSSDADSYQFLLVTTSKDFEYLDRCSADTIRELLSEVNSINIAAVEQWGKEQAVAREKTERARLRKEKGRILSEYQKMSGKSLQTLVLLSQRLGMIDSLPANNMFLSGLSAENLIRLEMQYQALKKKLWEYGTDVWQTNEQDMKMVMDEMFNRK